MLQLLSQDLKLLLRLRYPLPHKLFKFAMKLSTLNIVPLTKKPPKSCLISITKTSWKYFHSNWSLKSQKINQSVSNAKSRFLKGFTFSEETPIFAITRANGIAITIYRKNGSQSLGRLYKILTFEVTKFQKNH